MMRAFVDGMGWNLTVVSHRVITKDGFVLKMFRILGNGTEKFKSNPKPAVLLQHGLVASSEVFVHNGPNSLAFILLEAGYDVWMGNNRGNIYSRQNLHEKPSGRDYFDFSFFEYGHSDLTAMVDYIIGQTKQKKISYVGHSLGTSQMFTALAENDDDLQSKISVFIALAPVTRMDHTTNSFFLDASKDIDSLTYWGRIFHINELIGGGE